MNSIERFFRKPGMWKWWLTIVLFFATLLTYLNRQTIALCAPMICEEFNLTNEQYGRLISAFRLTYAIIHVPAGFMADHLAMRLTYALAVGFWSLAGAAAAVVFSFKQLLFTRAALGVGEAFNFPCATRIVANAMPPQDRALANGIFNSGAAVGSLTASLIITPLALQFGWRGAFLIVGAAGFFWIAMWYASTKKGSKAHAAVTRSGQPSDAAGVPAAPATRREAVGRFCREVLMHPAFWLLMLVSACINPSWYFLNEWIPKYMHDQRGFSVFAAGVVTIPIFLGADVGNLLGGGLVKFLASRGWGLAAARAATLALAAALIAPVALLTHIPSPWIGIGLLGMAGFGVTAIMVNYTACIQALSFKNVGLVSGILGMFGNVLSALVNPYIGKCVDRTGSYTAVFVAIPILAVTCLVAIASFDSLLKKRAGNDIATV